LELGVSAANQEVDFLSSSGVSWLWSKIHTACRLLCAPLTKAKQNKQQPTKTPNHVPLGPFKSRARTSKKTSHVLAVSMQEFNALLQARIYLENPNTNRKQLQGVSVQGKWNWIMRNYLLSHPEGTCW
jgi:hypothetical protein